MTDKYGMFHEPEHLPPGDPRNFGKKGEQNARDLGLNFKATVSRHGKANDATFDKFKSLHEGDVYIDPQRRILLEKREKKKKNITELPFKPIAPMKHSPTPGDFYGTYGKVEYITPLVETKKLKGEIQVPPRGLYTSPGKKGSYGMNKFTISERQGAHGVVDEYEYHADPMALQAQRDREQRDADRKARVSELPFKPSHPPKKGGAGVPNTTISKGLGIAGEWEYIPCDQRSFSRGRDPRLPEIPFKPSSIVKSGLDGNFERFPEYLHDPETLKMQAAAEKRKEDAAKLAPAGDWRPNSADKTDMIRSIVRMNIGS